MTSWPDLASLSPIDLAFVGDLAPEDVLYEFDGRPCIFTAFTPQRSLLLAYLAEELEDEGLLRFIVATTSESTVAGLQDGSVSVRDAIERGSHWLVDVDDSYRPQRAAACRLEDLPEDALPGSSTMLWASLEPALVVRLKGSDIRRGSVPATVFTQAAEIAGRAFKPVFEWAARKSRAEKGGRPPDWLRVLYGLPAQRIAYGSLEVAFREVDVSGFHQQELPLGEAVPPSAREIQESGWDAIREGLQWSVSEDQLPPNSGDEEKWRLILEAMKRLAPASTGPVTSVAVSGRLVGGPARSFELTRASTKKIRTALTELKKRHDFTLAVFKGRIRDLDLDKLTVVLRDVPDQPSDIFLALADERLLEDAREAHYQELEVNVVARSDDRKLWTAIEIEVVKGGSVEPE